VPKLVFVASHLLFRTCRITYVHREYLDGPLARGDRLIFAAFHQGVLFLPYNFRRYDVIVMVSASRDGDLIADTMALFGMHTARGSSTRLGSRALRAMIQEIRRERRNAGIIVDGPKGPPDVAKLGAILLARVTGLAVLPGSWWASRRLELGSWDRTIVPLPFSRLVFVYEAPLSVPRGATADEMEALREELTRRLVRARATARRLCGADTEARLASTRADGGPGSRST
jgi:lysophospholipid acyltransferase (LPLAT)-like uncharacterized protein